MQTPRRRPLEALYAAQNSVGPIRHFREWGRDLGNELASSFRANGALVKTSGDELNGLEAFCDFGEGRKIYRLELAEASVTAWPIDGIGKHFIVPGAETDFLRANSEEVIRIIAAANGFNADQLRFGPINFFILRRKLSNKEIAIIFCLNPAWFLGSDSWAVLEKEVGPGCSQIIFVADQWAQPMPWTQNDGRSPEFVATENCSGAFVIPRSKYCHPRLGIAAADAMTVFAEKPIVLDRRGMAVYLKGHKITFQGENQTFKYFCGICDMAGEAMPAAEFCATHLDRGAGNHDLIVHVRQIRKKVKKRLESAFQNEPEILDWAIKRFIAREPGTVLRPFPHSDVLFWDESLSHS